MDCRNPPRQVPEPHPPQPGRLHHPRQRHLVRKRADALGQVAVALRCHRRRRGPAAATPGTTRRRMRRSSTATCSAGEFEAMELAARPQHAPNASAQHRRLVGAVAQAERHAETRSTVASGSGSASASATRTVDVVDPPLAAPAHAPTSSICRVDVRQDTPAPRPARASRTLMSPVPPARSSSLRFGRGSSPATKLALPHRDGCPTTSDRSSDRIARRDAFETLRAPSALLGLDRHLAGNRNRSRPRYAAHRARVVAAHSMSSIRLHQNAGTPRSRDGDARPANAAGRPPSSAAPRCAALTCAGRCPPGLAARLTGAAVSPASAAAPSTY